MTITRMCFIGCKLTGVNCVNCCDCSVCREWLSGCGHLHYRFHLAFFHIDLMVMFGSTVSIWPWSILSVLNQGSGSWTWVGCPSEDTELFLCTSPLHLHTCKIRQDNALSSIFPQLFPPVSKGWAQCFLLTTHACKHMRCPCCLHAQSIHGHFSLHFQSRMCHYCCSH